MAQHRTSKAPARRARGNGSRLWIAAAVGTLGLLAVALVGLFGRPVDPPDPPQLLAPPPRASTTAPPGGTEPPSDGVDPSAAASGTRSRSGTPANRPAPSVPGDTAPTASPTAIGNGGPGAEGATDDQPRTLARGDRGEAVYDLQQRLRKAGIDTTPLSGVYDQPTEAAVQNYQSLRGVRTDPPGVYGPATRAALESET
ncbi:peptidoglycan-binding protein [Streptomyces sp. MS06]|uniref:peptidoglycan-binding domain-containing protein n=1 Tax=Streptomyces sp. MS06 TaxID=3385974 RepID=UPI0039A00FE7